MRLVLATLALGFLACSAKSDTLWTYTSQPLDGYQFSGNNFNAPSCNCSLTGTVDLSSAGQVVSYSFTDGRGDTLTSSNSTAFIDPFEGGRSTTPFSTIYTVILTGQNGNEFYIKAYDISEATDFILSGGVTIGYEEGLPGTWSSMPVAGGTSVPEPATGILLGVAICGVILIILSGFGKLLRIPIPSRRVI